MVNPDKGGEQHREVDVMHLLKSQADLPRTVMWPET
jgi:hypothetical protein